MDSRQERGCARSGPADSIGSGPPLDCSPEMLDASRGSHCPASDPVDVERAPARPCPTATPRWPLDRPAHGATRRSGWDLAIHSRARRPVYGGWRCSRHPKGKPCFPVCRRESGGTRNAAAIRAQRERAHDAGHAQRVRGARALRISLPALCARSADPLPPEPSDPCRRFRAEYVQLCEPSH